MNSFRMTLWMLTLTTALVACQTAALSTSVPVEQATQALTPTLPQEEITMVPVTPPDAASETMVMLVKGHLAQRLGIAVDQIVLSDVRPVMWRDASLGCPKPAIDYIPMETPGYKIVLEAGGQTYTYHTDADKRFVLCNRL
jgi:hypothetical protein